MMWCFGKLALRVLGALLCSLALVATNSTQCTGGNSSELFKGMKAVRYAPQMTGTDFSDKYNVFLSTLYLRDLSLIAAQLGGNTVRMAPPDYSLADKGTWLPFLDSCLERNISVVPSFSILPFLSLGAAASHMETAIQRKFGAFLRYFVKGASSRPFGAHPCLSTGGSLHAAVRLWSLEDLPPLEVLVQSSWKLTGGYSAQDDVVLAQRRNTKIAIRSIRNCLDRMFVSGPPAQLAISVDLDAPTATIGTPDFLGQLEAMMGSFEQPGLEGQLFDVWFLQVKLPPLWGAVRDVVQSIQALNTTHKVLKTVIPQLGIAAAVQRDKKPNLVPELQQEMLLWSWEQFQNTSCGSMIIDEFSDNWARSSSAACEAMGDSSMMQTFCGEPSGLLKETDVVAQEFLGLVSHTNWFLHSCVRPRWDKPEDITDLRNSFCLPTTGRIDKGFHFYHPSPPTNTTPVCYCVLPSHIHVYDTAGRFPSLLMWLGSLAVLVVLLGCVKVRSLARTLAASSGKLRISKAVAYFDNQLGMGRSAALRRHRPTRLSKGHSGISAPGESSETVMLLELRAFANDPRRKMEESVHLTVKCKSGHAEVIQPLVRNAWGVQQRVLEYQVLSEERCLGLRWNQWQEDTFGIAVTNVWRRALECYHLWAGQPRDYVKDVDIMFREILMFYTLQALAEQLLHCPEVINTLFHLLLGPEGDEEDGILRFDLMCKCLDDYIHNSDPFYMRGLTLDDLNDAVPRNLQNCSLEHLEMCIRNCTYKGPVKSKFYPARGMLAALKLTVDFRPALELKSMVAVLAYAAFSEDLKDRSQWFLQRWTFFHAFVLGVLELGGIWNLGYLHAGRARFGQMMRRFLGLILCCGILALFYLELGMAWVDEILPPAFLIGRAVYLVLLRNNLPLPLLRPHQPFPQLPKVVPKFGSEGATASFWKRLTYWGCVLLFCFLGELYVVFPVTEGLSFESLCSSRCEPLPWGSDCIACYGTMIILYLMLLSMLTIDVFMGHVLFTSLVGIVLGMQRGLNGMRKAPDSAVFLSDSELGVGENNPRAGRLMQSVFGNGWRRTWNLICYRLWKEDLLNSAEADELMQMAAKSYSEKNPDAAVYLHLLHPVVRERLTFFFASLRTICEDKLRMEENPPISHHGIFRTRDIIPLSQILPAVHEEVISTDAFLTVQNGANLRWIIMKYTKEWQFLTSRLAEKNLLHRYLGKAQPQVSDKTRIEVRLWASMRSQTVMRTVQGAVNYHIALEANPTIVSPHSTISKRDQLDKYVELIWSHQTHGEDNKKDQDVRRLLSLYEDYPIYLVFDLDMVHLTTQDRKVMGQMVRRRLRQEMNVPDDYFDDTNFFDHFPFMSCKAMYRKRPLLAERRQLVKDLQLSKLDAKFISSQVEAFDSASVLNLEVVEAMPRRLPLMIGKNKANLTQGKAGNQLMALRFCRGFAIQAMDANMGSFLGEAFKVAMVLKRFQPRGSSRDRVTCRLIGFREHIFTVAHGICGDINAVAEWCFGTSIQRVQTWLGVRMHYGHPDFIDLFWARNRGSMSKATPHINLSEDIYLGFNVKNRGEKSEHFDFLEWEKGREVSFNAASTFLYKISGGNIGVWRSKDLTEAAMVLPTVDQFSFYFATVGYFVSLTIIDATMYLYVGFHLLLTLASVSLHELGSLGTTMSVEWILGPGFFMYLPPLFEGLLEYGGLSEGLRRIMFGFDSTASIFPGGILYWVMTLMFFTFQNKTKASAVRQALRTGISTYRATGRPNANTRLTLIDTFLQYRAMHYQDACLFLFYYVLYRTANMGLAGALPMGTIVFACLCWLIVPTLFAPYPSWDNLCEDVTSFYHFLMRCPADRSRAELHQARMWLNVALGGNKPAQDVPKKGAKGQPGNLFEVLLADAWEKDTRFNYRFSDDCLSLLGSAGVSLVLFAILPAAAVEATELFLAIWVMHAFLVIMFGVFLDLLWIGVLIMVFMLLAAKATTLSSLLLAGMLFVQLLDTTAKLLLFATRRWRKLPGRGRQITAKNARVGMKVAPGKDWMYDMKKDDAKQNAAPGCSMVGTITNCDDCQELGYCEVLWVNGSEGRYRITTAWQTASDLRRHPDWYAVCVEATVLLFGAYHLNLLVGFVVLVANSVTTVVLIAVDSNWMGNWHARMLRMPTTPELESAGSIEGAGKHGAVGAPPIAMTELADAIVLEDLKREPWGKADSRPPKLDPFPAPAVMDDPAYRGATWREFCRIKLKKLSVSCISDLRKELGIVAVAVESRDGLECGLNVPLQTGGSLLFGFENGVEKWEALRGLLALEDLEEDPRDSVERVWLPLYKFEVPHALTGVSWAKRSGSLILNEDTMEDLKAEVDGQPFSQEDPSSDEDDDDVEVMAHLLGRVGPTKSCPPLMTPRKKSGEGTPRTPNRGPAARNKLSRSRDRDKKQKARAPDIRLPEICGIVRSSDGTTKWFPPTEAVLRPGDQMMLSQGSVRSFAMLRARALFGEHCVGAGFKMVYSLELPRDGRLRRSRGASTPKSHWTTPAQSEAGTPKTPRTPCRDDDEETWEASCSTFEFAKLFVLNFLTPAHSSSFACASKAAYRASRMPHLWSHAEAYGVVTVGFEHDEATQRAQLLFGFADDVPHEQGLSLFCGFRKTEDLDRCIGSKWLPVFNFRVPDTWVNKSVRAVLYEEEVAICGISRRDGWASRELWFPSLLEIFEESDEVVMTLQSAHVFAGKYQQQGPGGEPGHANAQVDGVASRGGSRGGFFQLPSTTTIASTTTTATTTTTTIPVQHLCFMWEWKAQTCAAD
ncbi:unnamed protein product [Polarella glacialis]|uniref:Glycosyl transferase 48 domain-containing protein n=1 Tax=Polarella glacialis TaxID=89957 RepID=A0A813DGJ6_POLGL|nr:unnamed protein product [Polarella glacialis]